MEPSQVNPYYKISYYYGSRDQGSIFHSFSNYSRILLKTCNPKW